ncbi:hypothetical protein Trydic_g7031 [Trypoxylus dichotomus]
MHQLELLRSKRTLGVNAEVKQTVISDQVFSRKRYSGEKVRDESCSSKDSGSFKEICDTNTINNENQSFMAILSQKLNSVASTANKEEIYSIKPTKTNDITKIKGWKRKFTSLYKNKLLEKSTSKPTETSIETTPLENKAPAPFKTDAKAAFASTNLDGFLHDSANLDISFEIPTLDSGNNDSSTNTSTAKDESQSKEDPILTSTSMLSNGEDELFKVAKIDTFNLYRPRTLGQKRRIWKLKSDTRLKERMEEVAKPRTLAEKRRMLDSDIDTRNKLKGDETGENGRIYSYVLHRGKKLKVPTRSENGIIAYIKSHYGKRDYIYVPRKVRQNKIKPSIFATIPVTPPQIMKYRPGPLSKKVALQEYSNDWKTEIKQLPKIFLEVTPKVKRPIAPTIRHLLPQYGFDLTEERISFALTALHSNTKPESFTFPVPYANKQECLMLRRKISRSEEIVPEIIKVEDNRTIEETVQNIVDKMLDYVEIKNTSEEVMHDDVTEMIMKEEKANIDERQSKVSKKRKAKQSKTNYELKRLNVKVIEVNLEDKGENDNCEKDFCRLGCVCKSLSTTSSLVSNHCGVPDCMFECKCNYEKKSRGNLKVTLPIGTDLLSEGAVNRLEVEAKKNLARVEKEFTQTVIQANNQTIVVGGRTNRQRRVTKLPKKYNDYIDDTDDGTDTAQGVDEIDEACKIDQKLKHWKPTPCTVYMSKLYLEQVVPYCMVHRLYDCHCEFKSLYETKKPETNEEVPDLSTNYDKFYGNLFKDGDFNYDILEWESCARTKGLPTDYYHLRNKSEKFVSTRKRRLDKFCKNPLHEVIHGEKVNESEDAAVNITDDFNDLIDFEHKIDSIDDSSDKNLQNNDKRARRKQSLLIRRDSSPTVQTKLLESGENAIQRRKKLKKHITHSSEGSPAPQNDSSSSSKHSEKYNNKYTELLKKYDLTERIAKFEQIFQTMSTPSAANLFTPSSLIQEKLTEILGKNVGADVQFRLIPWDILVKKYESGSLQLWHSTYFKKPRIIATDNKTVPKHFLNVRNYENIPNKEKIKADVIRWLVTKKVPGNNRENIFVIVQLTKTHCELCGLWEKKQNNQTDKMVLISQSYTENRMYSIVKKIMFSKCKFAKQMLIDPNISENAFRISAVSAYLPQISTNSKWRMIKLNSDFSVLSLHRNKYAIKYSDLMKVMKMARETDFTIVLKTSEVETNYPHPDFGMYASPGCDDVIFIGPYYHNEDHDITTLRYANRELIRTEIFCKMRGLKPPFSGTWLYQLSVASPGVASPGVANLQTIDLTEGESDSESKKQGKSAESFSTEKTSDPLSPTKSSEPLSPTKSSEPLSPTKCSESLPSPRKSSYPVCKPNNAELILKPSTNGTDSFKKGRKSKSIPLITSGDLLNYESGAEDYNVPPDFYNYVPEEVALSNFASDSKVYFIPNVPHMGFIVGYLKHEGVIVQWPSPKYAVKFPDITEATMYIQRELNACFIKNPSYQIFVEVEESVDSIKTNVFNWDLLNGYYIACRIGVVPLLELNRVNLKIIDLTIDEVESLAITIAQRKIFDKCYELARKLFLPTKIGLPKHTSEILKLIINEIRHQELMEHKLATYQARLIEKRQALRVKCNTVIRELQPLVNTKMQNAMQKILNFNTVLIGEKPETNGNDVICLDGDSEDDTSKEIHEGKNEEQTTPAPVADHPPIPKITVKKIQDLKEPSGSTFTATQTVAKVVSVKSFSILKNKSAGSESSASNTSSPSTASGSGDLQSTSSQSQTSPAPFIRPSSSNSNAMNCKTFTIKRSILNKKCSKFVIKTSNGKYMTIRAEDLKELPVKKLQPIAPNDPMISKLSMSTKRLLVPSKANGFLKVNFNEPSVFNDCKVVENGQPGAVETCSLVIPSPSLSTATSSTVSLSLLTSNQQQT